MDKVVGVIALFIMAVPLSKQRPKNGPRVKKSRLCYALVTLFRGVNIDCVSFHEDALQLP